MNQKNIITIVGTVAVLAAAASCSVIKKTPITLPNITSFEECAAAGYPIMETYPEQCRTPDNKIFVRMVKSSNEEMQVDLSASPLSGTAPLEVSFNADLEDSDRYIINYGDNSNSGPLQSRCLSSQPNPGSTGPAITCSTFTTHTYANPGTYSAILSRYFACLYSTPRCMIPEQILDTVTIDVTEK